MKEGGAERETHTGSIFNDSLLVVYVHYKGRERIHFTPQVVTLVVRKKGKKKQKAVNKYPCTVCSALSSVIAGCVVIYTAVRVWG